MKFQIKLMRNTNEFANTEISARSEKQARAKALRLNVDELDFYPGLPDSDFAVLEVTPLHEIAPHRNLPRAPQTKSIRKRRYTMKEKESFLKEMMDECLDGELMPELAVTNMAREHAEQTQRKLIAALKKQFALSHQDAMQVFVRALRERRSK